MSVKAVALLCVMIVNTAWVPAVGAQGRQEGIMVRGEWTLEVRNPDGTLAQRMTFENALGSAYPIAGLLTRQRTPGELNIGLFTNMEPNIFPFGSVGNLAYIVEPQHQTGTALPTFKTLSISLDGATIVMSGSATAFRGGAVDHVRTGAVSCLPTVTPGHCASGLAPGAPEFGPNQNNLGLLFTLTNLPAPVPLETGQILQVTVRITFSSAPHVVVQPPS